MAKVKRPTTRSEGHHNKKPFRLAENGEKIVESYICPVCNTPVRSLARHHRRHHGADQVRKPAGV